MKSEQQQIQESNLLADKIENFLVKVKKSLPQILAVIGILIVAMLGWGVYESMRGAKAAQAWTAYYFSDRDPANLISIADDYNATSASLWARQTAADSHLAKATDTVFTNRDVADKHYENALKEYEIVAKDAVDGFLSARAYYGVAQSQEGLGKREEAAKAYRKIGTLSNIDPEFKAEATKRADWLESKNGEDFYAWYVSNRESSPMPAPSNGLPSIPGLPTFDLPGLNLQQPGQPTEESKENAPVVTPEAGESTQSAQPESPKEESSQSNSANGEVAPQVPASEPPKPE